MKEFIFINRVPADYGQAEAKEVMEAWKQLTDQWKHDEIFVNSFVFPAEGVVAFGQPLNTSVGNVLADHLKIVSVIVIKAENLQVAAQVASLSPIIRQSGSVEIREIMGRPAS